MHEVENALRSTEGYVLLLKGVPGSGKTTYAVTLLEKLCLNGAKGVYISTRIDPVMLYKQFPGIEKSIPKENIIDATQSEFSEAEFQILYEDLSSFLRSVYSAVAEENVSILIVDSWDAVSFQIGKENKEKLESSMLDIARKTKTHLILITESVKEKRLDYLVDGILRFEKECIEERIVRRVFIDKMRGIRVKRSNYPFTLDEGKFTYFEIMELGSGGHKEITNENKELLSKGFYSTGIEDLDRIIGGYPIGGFVLLEIADESISWNYRPFLFHTVSNFVMNDCGVIYTPGEGSSSAFVKKLLLNYVAKEVLEKNLKMPTYSERKSKDPCLFNVGGDSLSLKEYLAKYVEVYKGFGSKKPILHILGLTRLNIYSDDEIRGTLSDAVRKLKETNNVLLGISKPSTKLKNEIREMADVHLKIMSIDGTLNLCGTKPYTIIYNISPSPSLPLGAEGEGKGKEGDEYQYQQLKLMPFV